jgi:hypothetical protein
MYCTVQWSKQRSDCHSNINTQPTGLWTSTRFSWQPEWTWYFTASVLVHVTGGGYNSSPERVRNCSHVMGRYVSQQCQTRTDCCIKPCASNSLDFAVSRKDWIRKRGLKNFQGIFHYPKLFFLLNIFSFASSAFTERTTNFVHISYQLRNTLAPTSCSSSISSYYRLSKIL